MTRPPGFGGSVESSRQRRPSDHESIVGLSLALKRSTDVLSSLGLWSPAKVSTHLLRCSTDSLVRSWIKASPPQQDPSTVNHQGASRPSLWCWSVHPGSWCESLSPAGQQDNWSPPPGTVPVDQFGNHQFISLLQRLQTGTQLVAFLQRCTRGDLLGKHLYASSTLRSWSEQRCLESGGTAGIPNWSRHVQNPVGFRHMSTVHSFEHGKTPAMTAVSSVWQPKSFGTIGMFYALLYLLLSLIWRGRPNNSGQTFETEMRSGPKLLDRRNEPGDLLWRSSRQMGASWETCQHAHETAAKRSPRAIQTGQRAGAPLGIVGKEMDVVELLHSRGEPGGSRYEAPLAPAPSKELRSTTTAEPETTSRLARDSPSSNGKCSSWRALTSCGEAWMHLIFKDYIFVMLPWRAYPMPFSNTGRCLRNNYLAHLEHLESFRLGL